MWFQNRRAKCRKHENQLHKGESILCFSSSSKTENQFNSFTPVCPLFPLRERQILKSNISNQFIMYLNNQPNSICDLRNLLIANSKHTHTPSVLVPFQISLHFQVKQPENVSHTRTLLFSDRVPSFSNFPPTFHHHRPQTTFNIFIRRKDLCLFI